jgi:hypothetical protein
MSADGQAILHYRGDSDSHLVRGLIAVSISLFSDRTRKADSRPRRLGRLKAVVRAERRGAVRSNLCTEIQRLIAELAPPSPAARLELRDLWGIAGRLAARLNAIGITTPLELHDADHRLIRERFSVVLERMVLELRGVACIGLEDVTPDRKSLIASRSFGQSVETRRGLEETVSVCAQRKRCAVRTS